MTYQFLEIERDGKLAILTLNRPDKRNALSLALRAEIIDAMNELADDRGVAVVIFAGRGKVFCAGFDLPELMHLPTEKRADYARNSDDYHRAVIEFPKPTIAAIQGAAMGGGFDLAVMCDLRIATNHAAFAHPEIKFGAPVLFRPLREIVGGGMARELCMTGRKLDAGEALRIGLISEIVGEEELLATCKIAANKIAEAPLHTLIDLKKQVVGAFGGWDGISGDGGSFFFDRIGGQT